MKIATVRIKAFRGFNKEFTFDFTPALVLLHGNNGFGKTSLFDAIEWALTGQISRYQESQEKTESEYITNQHAHKGGAAAEVDVSLVSDGVTYKVSRIRSGEVKIFRNGEPIGDSPDAAHSILTNAAALPSGIDRNEFSSMLLRSILLTQDQISEFLSDEKPPARFSSLSKMLGTREFGAFPTTIAGAIKVLSGRIDPLSNISERTSHDLILKQNQLKLERERKVLSLDVPDATAFVHERLKTLVPRIFEAADLKAEPFEKLSGPALVQYAVDLAGTSEMALKLAKNRSHAKHEKLAELEEALPSFLRDKNRLRQLDVSIKRNETSLTRIKGQLKSHQSLILRLESKISGFQIQQRELISRRQTIEALSSRGQEFIAAVTGIAQLKVNLKSKQKTLQGKKRELGTARRTLRTLRATSARLQRSLKTESRTHKELDVLLSKLLNFAAGRDCPACGAEWRDTKTLQDAIKGHIGSGARNLTALEQSVGSQRPLLEDISTSIETLEEEASSLAEEAEHVYDELQTLAEQKTSFERDYKSTLNTNRKPTPRSIAAIARQSSRISKDEGKTAKRLIGLREHRQVLKNKLAKIDAKRDALAAAISRYHQERERVSALLAHVEELGETLEMELAVASVKKELSSVVTKNEALGVLETELQTFNKQLAYVQSKSIQIQLEHEIKSLSATLAENRAQIDKLQKAAQLAEQIHDYSQEAVKELNRTKVNEYLPAINEFYSRLCPHPFFKAIDFKFKRNPQGSPTLFIKAVDTQNRTVTSNAALTFSQSQLNVLALCIFMSMNRLQNWCKLQSVFIDDPIQNMDGLNTLRFIDMIRTFRKNHQIVISTQDSNVVGLFRKKLGTEDPKQFATYHYVGYTREGPRIVQS